jgi:hypothetical protein
MYFVIHELFNITLREAVGPVGPVGMGLIQMLPFQRKKRAIKKMTNDSKIVDANGKENTLPNNLKRTSPGRRPIPNFSSHGSNAENTMIAIKITTTQRIIISILGGLP